MRFAVVARYLHHHQCFAVVQADEEEALAAGPDGDRANRQINFSSQRNNTGRQNSFKRSRLPELIQKAFKTGEYNPKSSDAKKPHLRPITVYPSVAVIDGVPYDVQLAAKRKANGDQELIFYDLRVRGKGKKESLKVPEASPENGISVPPTDSLKTQGLSDTRIADFFCRCQDYR